MNVYLSIGNSDDKLTQAEWSQFVSHMAAELNSWTCQIHGTWFSRPDDPWQNANWCLEFIDEAHMNQARAEVIRIRRYWRQDSVAWAVAEPEFI